MPTVTLPLGPITYADEGDPTGRPVVCVHGLAADGELWAATSAALGDRVRVLRPTLPLGSHRTPTTGALTPRAVAATILAFLDELGLEDPVLLGNDTGGALCQLALQAQPSRVRRLVLTNCDAFTTFPPFPFNALRPAARVPGLLTALMQPTRIALLRHAGLYGILASERDDALWGRWVAPFHADREIRRQTASFIAAVRPQELDAATRALPDWGGDAVVVWGMRDRFFRPALGRRLADVLGAPFVEVDSAKTFVPLDAPRELAEVVADVATRERGPAAPGVVTAGGSPG